MNEKRQIIKSTFLVSLVNFGAKILGLLKTIVIAAVFGAGASMDAFWVAYMLPTALPMIMKGIISGAFIPQFMKTLNNGEDNADWNGVNTLFTSLIVLIVLFSLMFVVFPGSIVSVIAPGSGDQVKWLAMDLIQILSIATLALGINAILSAVSHARKMFFVASLEGVVSNSVIIISCFVFVEAYGVYAIAWSVAIGFLTHTVLLLIDQRSIILRYVRIRFQFKHDDFKTPFLNCYPLIVGYGSSIFMGIVDNQFLSYLGEGAIAAVSFAVMLAYLPQEVFGAAIITTFFPSFSEHIARKDRNGLFSTYTNGLSMLATIMLPAACILFVFSEECIDVVFRRGSFDESDALKTASVLSMLSVGMMFRAMTYYNFRLFHASQMMWLPVFVGLVGLTINITGNFLLVEPLGVAGIALATAIAMTCNFLLSTLIIQKRYKFRVFSYLFGPMFKLLVMTGVSLSVAWYISILVGDYIQVDNTTLRGLISLMGLVPGAGLFVLLGYVLKNKETIMFTDLVKSRF